MVRRKIEPVVLAKSLETLPFDALEPFSDPYACINVSPHIPFHSPVHPPKPKTLLPLHDPFKPLRREPLLHCDARRSAPVGLGAFGVARLRLICPKPRGLGLRIYGLGS